MPCRFSLLCLCLGSSLVLYSLPQQGNAVTGKAEIIQNNDHMQVTASDRAVLNWDSFSIDKAETLQFVQPTDKSAVLNRVIGLTESRLDGKLLANGHVYLINPNGLIIGKDAVIDTAKFVGSTLQISNEDFLNNTDLLFQGDSTASIVNLGTINSSQGPVTLIAQKINNEGKITSPEAVSLIAGHEILLSSSGNLLHVRPDIKSEGIESSGMIQVLQTRIEKDGLHSLAIQTMDEHDASEIVAVGGKILLRAEGSPVAVSGELTATGGSIHILGETVHVKDSASIDASGVYGGGEILIGGAYQGDNPNIPNARITFVEENVLLKADATLNGDGGKVIVWSDEATVYRGRSFVRGGEEGGNGGLTEVSGKFLNFKGTADSTAPLGKFGMLLLDPTDVTISTAISTESPVFNATGPICGFNANNTDIANFPAAAPDPTNINIGDLNTALSTNCVTINAASAGSAPTNGGSITVNSTALNPISWSVETTLTMEAVTFLTVNGPITNTSPTSAFTAIALSNTGASASPSTPTGYVGITIGATGAVTTNAANITITGQGFATTANNEYGVSIVAGGQVQSTGGGSVTITGTGGGGTGEFNYGINVGNNTAFVTSGSGVLTLMGTGGNGIGSSPTTGSSLFGINTGSGVSFTANGSSSIILNGSGGPNSQEATNVGITIGSTNVFTANGSSTVSLIGQGGGTNAANVLVNGNNNGITIDGGATFTNNGTSTMTLTGAGGGVSGVGTGSNNIGVSLGGLGTNITFIGSNLVTPNFTITGTGGPGGMGGFNRAVLIDASLLLGNATSLEFLNCTGGGPVDIENTGILINGSIGATSPLNDNIALSFTNINGGLSQTVGLAEEEIAIIIAASSTISLPGAGSSIAFNHIHGGDNTGTYTTSSLNHGIELQGSLYAATIMGTDITGGNGLSNNVGFFINGGNLGADPAFSLPVNISITATGQGSQVLSSDVFGIEFAGGNLFAPNGGTITLIGTSLTPAAGVGLSESNTGLFISSLTALELNGTTLNLTGTGGRTGTGGEARGLQFGGVGGSTIGTLTLTNNSSIHFINSTGGVSGFGNAQGVEWAMAITTTIDDASSQIVFNNNKGGPTSLSPFQGNDNGVSIGTIVLPNASIVISNNTGGDAGVATSRGNIGASIGTLSSPSIQISNNVGGGSGALSTGNFGVSITGTLGQTGKQEIISITGTGGASTGLNNAGIVFGAASITNIDAGGSLTVDGTGAIPAPLTANGEHYGVQFVAGSVLNIGTTSAASVTISGTGGSSNGAPIAQGNHGVLMQGTVNLNNAGSSLVFESCTGGTNTGNGNSSGVVWGSAITNVANSSVTFGTALGPIVGGISGAAGSGNNYGVDITSLLQLSGGASTVTFNNVTGGDLNNPTTSNFGVLVASGGTLSAPIIMASDVTGGKAGADNYGFDVAGTLGQTGAASTINITAAGGAGTGLNNIGIFVSGTVEIDDAGSLTLIGSGAIPSPLTANGGHHGVNFFTGSNLNIGSTAAASAVITGTGGQSTSGAASDGVFMQGSVQLNASSLSFLSCQGGTSSAGGNMGVLWHSAVTSSPGGAIVFGSAIGPIVGGISGVGGTGGNFGVDINSSLQLNNSSSTITFNTVTGGDHLAGTTSNYGVSIDSGATLSAASIMGTNITGGAAGPNNYGFNISGTLGETGAKETVSITATGGGTTLGGGGTGLNNDGIFVSGTGTVIGDSGGSLTLIGVGGTNGGSAGANHGVNFFTGSNLTLGITSAAAAVITGTGGNGSASCDGVLMQGAVTLNSSSLSFLSCTGGNGVLAHNVGVLWESTSITNGANALVAFGSAAGPILGGSSSVIGSDHGVEINTSLQLTGAFSTVTFNNVTGGDAGTGTNGNFGVVIDVGATLSAGTITGTNIIGGGASLLTAGNNNYGFNVAGTLGQTVVPATISITASGGVGVGTGNIGIIVTGTAIIDSGGSLTLNGTGCNLPTSGGGNHGVDFSGSLIAGTTSAATVTITGTGGSGTVSNDGVLMQGTLTLNSSSLVFFGCQGGTNTTGHNTGVFWDPTTLTSGANASVTFGSIGGSIIGGFSGLGGGGNNYGVEFATSLQLTGIPSTVTFNNIRGGDSGFGTDSNYGVFIPFGSTLSASIIFGMNTSGGGLLALPTGNDNYGFNISGTLGQAALPATISIAAAGGAGTGINNIGVFVPAAGTVIIDSGGTLALNGTGGNLSTSMGANHGVNFVALSNLNIGTTAASTATISGTGGKGTAFASDGVLMQGNVVLNSSSLSFTNSLGGTYVSGQNIGVFWDPVFTSGVNASLSFNSISGGTSGVGGLGNNYGVQIPIPILLSNGSSMTFSNILGGDSGNGTPSNHGVLVTADITAQTITGTSIKGGAGKNNNIGFYLTNGSIMGSGLTQSIAITASSLGTGSGEVGIQVDQTSKISVTGNATIALTGTSNLYGISITDVTSEIIAANGNITFKSPGSSMFFGNGIAVQSNLGNILAIADVNIVESGGASITTTGGTIQLVVDNAFPTPPGVGPGVFNIPDLVLTANGATIQLWGGLVNTGIFPASIGGAAYVAQKFQENGIYFPFGTYPAGDPYFIYYKTLLPSVTSPAINDFSIAIAEAFQSWANNWYQDYLDQDRYPPAYTPKGMNIIIPSLVALKPIRQQSFALQKQEEPRGGSRSYWP